MLCETKLKLLHASNIAANKFALTTWAESTDYELLYEFLYKATLSEQQPMKLSWDKVILAVCAETLVACS